MLYLYQSIFLYSVLLFTSLSAYQYDLAVCAIFRDEAPYLKEWIEFHKIVGVQHFYLYNNLSVDNYLQVLSPYIQSGDVELTDWPFESTDQTVWGPIQCAAYEHALRIANGIAEWVAIIDTDEFLVPVKKKKITSLLKSYEDYGGLVINWLMFGTSGIDKIPKNQTLVETLTKRAATDWNENHLVKSIVRPERIILDWTTGWTPHHLTYQPGYHAVDAHFNPVTSFSSEAVTINEIRIHHYWTRDKDYFYHVKLTRRQKWLDDPLGCIDKVRNYENIADKTIFQFIPKLRKKLGLKKRHDN